MKAWLVSKPGPTVNDRINTPSDSSIFASLLHRLYAAMSVGLLRIMYYYYFRTLPLSTSPSDWRSIRHELYRPKGMQYGVDIKRLFISLQSDFF